MVLFLMYFKQDRTGKIVFKLLDKDPSQLPGTLRTEVIILGHYHLLLFASFEYS